MGQQKNASAGRPFSGPVLSFFFFFFPESLGVIGGCLPCQPSIRPQWAICFQINNRTFFLWLLRRYCCLLPGVDKPSNMRLCRQSTTSIQQSSTRDSCWYRQQFPWRPTCWQRFVFHFGLHSWRPQLHIRPQHTHVKLINISPLIQFPIRRWRRTIINRQRSHFSYILNESFQSHFCRLIKYETGDDA